MNDQYKHLKQTYKHLKPTIIKSYNNWDIVLVEEHNVFNNNKQKLRPFLVLKINSFYKEFVVLKISSKKPRNNINYLPIDLNNSDYPEGSYIWITGIYTIKYSSVKYSGNRWKYTEEDKAHLHEMISKYLFS